MKQKILHLAATFAALLTLRPRGAVLANIAEGQHLASQGITLETDVAITERNLLMKRGGAANRVTPCDAAGTPIGVCSDEAANAGDIVNMRTFNSDLTIPVVAATAEQRAKFFASIEETSPRLPGRFFSK